MHKVNYSRLTASHSGFWSALPLASPVLSGQQNHHLVSTPCPSTDAVYLHSHPFSLFGRQRFLQVTLTSLGSSTAQRAEGNGA